MSVKCMTRVWEYSQQKGSKRLLLLAIADHADDNGFAWPGIPRLATKTRLSERHVRRMIAEITADGELFVNPRTGTSNQYIVTVGLSDPEFLTVLTDRLDIPRSEALSIVDNLSPLTTCQGGGDNLSGGGDSCVRGGMTHVSPEPSYNHHITPNETSGAAKKPPPTRDPTYLPETDEQLGILFPQTCQGLRDQLDLIQRASWNIRGDDIRSAMAHFLKASGLPIPNDKSTRSQWIKAVRIHVNNFGVGLLEQAYPLALARCKNVTIGWPGALDKTLPAVVRDMQNGGNHAPHSTRRAGPGDGRRQDTTATEQAEWARRLTS